MSQPRVNTRKSFNIRLCPSGLVVLALLSIAGSRGEGLLATPAPEAGTLTIYPAAVQLSTRRDFQSILAQWKTPSGVTRDVTADAELSVEHPDLVSIEGPTLHPVADGSTTLTIAYAGQSRQVPVEVSAATADRPISFRLDVAPVFMKAGCNSGSCHGAARGKDGFRLSLFGYDPAGDYYRLTRELSGRRLDMARVHDSLLLEKSAGLVSHTGGERFDRDSELYATLARWIESGAPDDPTDVAKATSIELYPPEAVLDGRDSAQQLMVRATYSDGSTRDVTQLAYFSTNNETAAAVNETGRVTAGERGEAFLMARFDTFTVGSHFVVLPKDLQFEFPETRVNNYIDELIDAKLRKLRIAPSVICDDATFLRRASLDITGRLPSREEYESFLADESKDKHSRVIDRLLERKEFVELWVMKWAELLQIRSTNRVSYKSTLLYYNWLQDRIGRNVPMDEMVRELLSASGGTFSNPATNYYQGVNDTLKVAENVAQVFLGMRIQCAQCHNHPFDRWTQDDYYGFASFFSQVGRKQGEDPRETIVFNRGSGEVNHPVTRKPKPPKFLGSAIPDVKGKDRREVLADWLASSENPYFATNLANIVWAHFFGQGLIDEVDDVRVSNPPSNAPLLQELGRRFTEYRYDFKKLVRDICNSRTYQLSTQTNETNAKDHRNFSHATLRRIRAEVLLDCVSQVTEAPDKFRGLPRGARAVQIADGRTSNYFLSTFGRAKRDTVCSCEVQMEPNLSQALHLLNGDTISRKIRQGDIVRRMLKEKKSHEDIIEDLTLRCLGRRPTERELESYREVLAEEKRPERALEDIFWSLLNSREFLFNH